MHLEMFLIKVKFFFCKKLQKLIEEKKILILALVL